MWHIDINPEPAMQALPLVLFTAFVLVTFVWRSWIAWRATGINPVVLPSDDSVEGYVGRTMRVVVGATLLALALHAAGLDAALGAGLWAGNRFAFGAGALLGLAALAWVAVAQRQMGASWRIGIDHARDTSLVTQGLYRWSRNPIFLGLRIALAGVVLMVPNTVVIAAAVAGELLMQVQVRLEEAHLAARHGAAYDSYRARVGRWLGRPA